MRRQSVTFFLSGFNPDSGTRRTRDVVREVLVQHYSDQLVAEFIDEELPRLQAELVDEFNARYAAGQPIRFQIVDSAGVGSRVKGNRSKAARHEIAFQEILNRLTSDEFEDLAAVLLRLIGCSIVFATPQSHDQGVDAFGYQEVIAPVPYGVTHHLTWIAQAKHYKATSVSTNEIRELVGTKELLLAKAFSTVDQRYVELKLRNYSPSAIALITTEEIPSTVRRLAENSGAYVFAASDLRHLIAPKLPRVSLRSLRRFITVQMRTIDRLK